MSDNNTEQPKKAIAIRYKEDQERAPRVIAKGAGFIAEQILDAAKQNAIPVYQNKTLTGMLMAVELDREIPPELYQAVAEVLAYIYYVDQKVGKRPNWGSILRQMKE
ncbi:MAG TPA: EscU/YscU/HrcU family type III secretion system export apparatus switch protein [Methylomusa anaerophila]|uniref:Flagellar biosynthetic protein FlhB n=1 Tax=Methylomusa anaerophila TaxID=1930071 RepID=A0A348AQ61_9FIRM|nr:EscU/YscU/HrcU family type III secretion system export apparatus switch protein [Methylomusa anaerophila]BBB93209.1 flagellar biosynthetic protein FlhB [Methylomusa anaerophila]HML86959.1 EscU/YscU/HrcU family type III secretion system export apparatus switch protein [Methylomusa anaerophila]